MDPYAEDSGYQSFVKIAECLEGDEMELPREKDGTVLLSTVQGQFPGAAGLKYRSSSGGWSVIRSEDNILDPPIGGWGETTYYVTEVAYPLKRKASSAVSDEASASETNSPEYSAPPVKSAKSEATSPEDSAPVVNSEDSSPEDSAPAAKSSNPLLNDLIVLGLPYSTTADELEEYFTKTCGELAFHEVKFKNKTTESRGFGFIRFKTVEAAKEALSGDHQLMGRKLDIKSSKKKETPIKLFVGQLPAGTTQARLHEYFSEFGELENAYIPTVRNFGFVTYVDKDKGRKVIGMKHQLDGTPITVTTADTKNGKPRDQRQSRNTSNSGNNNWNMSRQNAYDPMRMQGSSGGGNVLATGLQNLLYAYLAGQR